MPQPDDDLLFSADEEDEAPAAPAGAEPPGWRLLVVDDDEFIHQTTTFALTRFGFAGRGLSLSHAYSAKEAREMLAREAPYACVLLDVVMESDHAGLDLVHHIRRDRADDMTRIILRTGQAGMVPEIQVVQDYDINDYREKSLTTANHLRTSLTSALRSYQQIATIQDNRRGLERVIQASAALFSRPGLHDFAEGVLLQIAELLRALPDGMVVCASSDGALQVLAAAGRYTGRAQTPLLADDPLHEALRRVLAQGGSAFDGLTSYLHLPRGKLGDFVIVLHTEQPIGETERSLLELLGINIGIGFDNALMYGQMEQLAFSDKLTGLPNLNGFLRTLGDGPSTGSRLVAFVDVDHFEVINDGLGRKVGDALLRSLAQDLQDVSALSLVARVGGDVFGVVSDVPESEMAALLGGLCERLQRTLEIEGHAVSLSVSIGAARFGAGLSPEAACANAGMALKTAKRERQGGYLLFRDSMSTELQDRLRLSARMDRALEKREFLLHYQPQVSLQSGRMIGVEALVRWRDGDKLVPPDRFIPVAESSGLILPLGRWVLEEAVAQQKRWAATGLRLRMAVNLSARQLLEDEGLVEYLRGLLAGVDASLFELEVTESGVIGDVEAGRGRLELLRGLGVQIAIDDFGTGYSSLGQLRHLPAQRLKIDRVFINGIARDPDDLHIAEMIVGMGKRIGLSVLAEGVEDDEQRQILARLGCHEAQGWFYARALPADEVPAFAAKVGVEAEPSGG